MEGPSHLAGGLEEAVVDLEIGKDALGRDEDTPKLCA